MWKDRAWESMKDKEALSDPVMRPVNWWVVTLRPLVHTVNW